MFTRLLTRALIALCLSLLAAPADAAGRIRGAIGSLLKPGAQTVGAVACTVVAGPVAATAESAETDVLCLDTSIQMRLVWLRFPATDRSRVRRTVTMGSTVAVAYSSPGTRTGVLQANRWRSRRAGNPARSDFLKMDAARLPLLAWALREQPEVAQHFNLAFHPVAEQLHQVFELFTSLGHPVPGLWDRPARAESRAVPAAADLQSALDIAAGDIVDLEQALSSCKAILKSTEKAIAGVGPVAESIAVSKHGGADHHGEVEPFQRLVDVLVSISSFSESHPIDR